LDTAATYEYSHVLAAHTFEFAAAAAATSCPPQRARPIYLRIAPAHSAKGRGKSVSPVPVLTWEGRAPVPVQMWQGRAPYSPTRRSSARAGHRNCCPPAQRCTPLVPHLHRDWAHPSHIGGGTGLTPPTSAPGLGLTPSTSAPGLGSPLPHLHRDLVSSRRAVPVAARACHGPSGLARRMLHGMGCARDARCTCGCIAGRAEHSMPCDSPERLRA
jgi:hypothetical protein